MKQIKKRSYPPFNMGISLMLVTFLVLCMVIFAALSLSGALKDYRYSKQNALRTSAYYEANNKAEVILAELYENPPKDQSENRLEYLIPIDEDEGLQVVLDVISFDKPEYQIVTWKQISTKEWSGSDTLPVLESK